MYDYSYEDEARDDYIQSLEEEGLTQDEIDARLAEHDSRDDDPDLHFAEPGGESALRAASRNNPRNLPCPTCGAENVLTPADRRRGYQCDRCADRDEGRGY